jgi:hypothetical protein
MLRITSVLFAAALLAQPAEAGVMYKWHQTAASDTMPKGMTMELYFSDAAVQQGSLKLDIETQCWIGDCYDPQDSLLSLRFWVEENQQSYMHYGYRKKPHYGYGETISLELNFLPGGLLSGWIRANDTNSDFWMQSIGSTFTMTEFRSDEGICTREFEFCSGESGQLRAEVPEPSSAAIAGLGLLAAWFGRRRRR